MPALAAGAVLLFSGLLARAQSTPAAAPLAVPDQTPNAAGAKDALMARAEMLYDSAEKSGLSAFNCQVHPDWNLIMTSSRKGAPLPADDPRLPLLSEVKIALHGRLNGSSTLDWQPPAKPLSSSAQATLDTAHRGIEQTLLGVLKLWTPLVNGSVPESFGEDGFALTQSESGYTLRSKDKQHSQTEQFDRNLLLTQFITVESGSTIDVMPVFAPAGEGLRLSSFVARIQSANAVQEMHVALEYALAAQSTGAAQAIPSKVAIEIPNAVTMNFALDGCVANPPAN
jgi:hypothetical protein